MPAGRRGVYGRLPDTDRLGAQQLAERIRVAIEQSQVSASRTGRPIRCTVTISVSAALTGSQAFDEVMEQADAALYRGKAVGRNRIEYVPV